VLDRRQSAGGQVFHNAGEHSEADCEKLGPDYVKGHKMVRAFQRSTASFRGGSTVWNITAGKVFVSREGKSEVLAARQILIAAGAMERPVPIPGWTLPGVLTAGAVDVMLKSSFLAPKGPVLLCGNGPLMIQTAEHLKKFNVPVAGIVLTNGLTPLIRAMPYFGGALRKPRYLARGMGMSMRMLFGNRCFPGSRTLSVTGSSGSFAVKFTALGKNRSLQGENVLLHGGIIPETRITRLLRCRHVWNPLQRYWHVDTDIWGRTTAPGMRVAGDCAGVRGADAALELGRLSALDAARELGAITMDKRDAEASASLRALREHTAMQRFMDRLFAPSEDSLVPADEAIVCRCEELTAGELKKAIVAGCLSLDGLKSQARPGMGMCQGRMCGPAVAELIAQACGLPMERLDPYHAQFPLFPITLRELIDMSIPPEGF
jgi:thioredoxin reductase